jgi:hypothetical protein
MATPRVFWDVFENLWEFREVNTIEMAYLLWSPAGPVVGPNCHGRRKDIERAYGPLIGAA